MQLFKKETLTQLFSMDIAKFLRLPSLKNICKWLLPYCFNGSLINRPKGLTSILYESARLQGPSHRSSFLLLLFFYFYFLLIFFFFFAFVLNRVPTYVRISKTNTFDESINPAGTYLLKVNKRNTGTRCERCSKLTIMTPEHWYLYCQF